MQIQLKQSEIEAALKMFVTHQGINLNNREVTIGFTAGRSGTGISADMDIGDVHAPVQDTYVQKRCLANTDVVTALYKETTPMQQAEAQTNEQTLTEAVEAAAVPEQTPPVSSLFGS